MSAYDESKCRERDDPFAQLVDEIADDLFNGRSVDFDELAEQHPQFADQLQEIGPTLVVLGQWGGAMLPNTPATKPPSTGREPAGVDRNIDGDLASEIAATTDIRQPLALGDFRLLRILGRGGMGIVYEAEQLSLGRHVAVKVLPFAALLDQRQLERFKNEARAAAMLKHANIVSVHSVGVERGVHYYAMELIDGLSLAEIIATPRNLPTDPLAETIPYAVLSTLRDHSRKQFYDNAARIGVQVAHAIHYAHLQGVVHRDIKPSNLLVDADGNVHVTDFGLARVSAGTDITMTGDFAGTLRYMSPEQLSENDIVDQRTDVYSLGLTLYELVTGKAAYDGTGREQLLLQMQQGEPPPPSRRDPQIPRDLENVLLKATAQRRDERYATAQALGEDLERFLDRRPVVARRIGPFRRGGRWCLRHRSKAALIGLVGLLLLSAAIGGPWAALRQRSVAIRQRHAAYDRDMARAHMHIHHGEIDQAVDLLKAYLPDQEGEGSDYRSFEFFELVERCRRRLEALEIDLATPCWGLATSPSGDIAVGTHIRGPLVFDGSTGRRKWPAANAKDLAAASTGLAYSADGRFLLSTSKNKTLRIWATGVGKIVYEEQLKALPYSVAVNSDGMIAIGTSATEDDQFPHATPTEIVRYQLLEPSTNFADEATKISLVRLPSLRGAVGVARDVVFTPDGGRLAAGSEDGVLRVWNTETGRIEAQFTDFRGPVMSVAISPDGRLICGAGGDFRGKWRGGEALVFDLEQHTKVAAVYPSHVVFSTVFASNNRLITGGVDRRIAIWDTSDGSLIEAINAHSDTIRRLVVTSDPRRLASGGDDNVVRVWNLDRSGAPQRLGEDEALSDIQDLAFSADTTMLASASGDRGIRIWDPLDGKLIQTLGHHQYGATGVDFSPDAALVASLASDWPADPAGASELKIWTLDTGEVATFHIDGLVYGRSIAFAPSGNHLAIVGRDRLLLWNVIEARIDREAKTVPGIRVVFSRDGKLIGTAGGIWQYPSLTKLCDLPKQPARNRYAIAIHPQNDYFATSDPQTHDIVLYSTSGGAEMGRLAGHSEIIFHLHFSHDGKRLASSSQAGLVIVWNLETGNEIIRYRNHQFYVWSALFSPNDRMLASCQGGRFLPPTIMVRRSATPSGARSLLERRFTANE